MEHTHGQESYLTTHQDSFVHLHLHTQYSLLDGAIRIKDLIQRGTEFGMPAIAQTDHGNMFGAIDFYSACWGAGIKPILGSEIYFTPGSRFDRKAAKKAKTLASQDAEEGKYQIHHLILLAKNNKGYENLCALISKAYLEGFYYKPRADLDLLKQYSEGLIATTACLKGEVGYNFFTDQDDRAHQAIHKLREIFKDDFYLELQENGLEEQMIVNKKIISFAQENSIPIVATNDCHYIDPEDAKAQEVLLCVQTGKTFSDQNRMKLTSNEFYFKSAQKMRENFAYLPEACDNTLRIADKCNVNLKWKDDKGRQVYHLPQFEIKTGESENEFFARTVREGLEERFEGPHFAKLIDQHDWESELKPKYIERLETEVEMIKKTGFAGYFLIVSDFIRWSKSHGIPVGPGRGSGAGSLVAYALFITNINPIPFNLLFERFLNPERISMPDFDVDFCQSGRQKVIEYVTEKYGEDKVAQIITFGKLQAKAVLRDVSRVYDLPYAEADMLAKLVPDELGINLEQALEKEPKINELCEKDPKIRQIVKISRRLEGLLRHASIHAAGVIITNKPLISYCPLFKGRDDEQVVQFDKDFSEKIGLVKFDFLGLKTLTVIDQASKFIQRDCKPDFDIEAIDLEDPKVYEFISHGDTKGVFQLESSGMIDLCKRIQPHSLEEISAINALYRPGPLESGMVDDFIEIKHGRKEMTLPFPELESVLKETYGVIVYQEQVMNIARIVAGYSLGQADILRKAMGKKIIKMMDEHRKIFTEGAKERGFDAKKASDLFDLMANFAAYGFNKSHAVAYGLIAYQTAFLKKYYTPQFFAALISTEMNNTDKVTAYIHDAKNYGIHVYPPDINESLWSFNVVDENIRFGMGAVKNVGGNAVQELIREREENGPFKGLIDFAKRVNLKVVNRRMIESLIKVGAFDDSEKLNRKTLLENLEVILTFASRHQEEKAMGQVNLFESSESVGGKSEEELLDIHYLDDFTDKEKLSYENELIGIYVSGHPLNRYQAIIEQLASMSIAEVNEVRGQDKREMSLAGIVSSLKPIITKKGDRMAFANLEDLQGKIECIIFPKTYAEFGELLTDDQPLIMSGFVNLSEEPRKFFPTKIQHLQDETQERVSGIRVNIPLEKLTERKLAEFKQVLLSFRGTVPLHMVFESSTGRARLPLGEDFFVQPSPQLAALVNQLFQSNAVRFVVDGQLQENISQQ